jgi:hypothetical protein
MSDDFTIHYNDLVGVVCVTGMKAFSRKHGLDYSDFLKRGIKASVLLSTKSRIAKQIVFTVRAKHGK